MRLKRSATAWLCELTCGVAPGAAIGGCDPPQPESNRATFPVASGANVRME